MIGGAAELERSALVRGVLAGVVLVGPAAALSAFVADGDEASGVAAVALLVVTLVGFGLSGAVTASRVGALPFTHGALAGLSTYSVVQAAVLVASSLGGRDEQVNVAALAISGLAASAAGMIGALVASRGGPPRDGDRDTRPRPGGGDT